MNIVYDTLHTFTVNSGISRLQIPVISDILKFHNSERDLPVFPDKDYFLCSEVTDLNSYNSWSTARYMQLEVENITFDFTQDLNWEPGEFGEESYSCYWGDRSSARDMILDHDGFAIRFYEKPSWSSGLEGWARCWGAPYKNGIILWNGYGKQLTEIAYAMGQYFNHPVVPILLSNKGTGEGILYINAYHNYYIGPDEIKYRDDIDFDWDELGTIACRECGDTVYPWEDGFEEDLKFCEACRYEKVFYCDRCHEYKDKIEKTLQSDWGNLYCEECAIDTYYRKIGSPERYYITIADGSVFRGRLADVEVKDNMFYVKVK